MTNRTCETPINDICETPMKDIIKNRLCTYQINRTDIKHTKKALKEELSEYLNRPLDDIVIGCDSIEIVVDSIDNEQYAQIGDLFDNVYIDNWRGDQLKIYVDLEEEQE